MYYSLILIFVIFSLPLDMFSIEVFSKMEYIHSYLGNIDLYNMNITMSIGSIIRPLANFLLMISILFKLDIDYFWNDPELAP
jgi:hypothetical protein